MLPLCHFKLSLTLLFPACQKKTPQSLADAHQGERPFSASTLQGAVPPGRATFSCLATPSEVSFVQTLRAQLKPSQPCTAKHRQEQVQWRAPKMINELEHLLYKEAGRAVFVQPGGGKSQGESYPWVKISDRGSREDKAKFFSGQEATGTNRNTKNFILW